jgi:hypothetical protein
MKVHGYLVTPANPKGGGKLKCCWDRAITIFSKDGKKVLGRFSHISHSLSGAENAAWMTFSVPLDSGEMDSLGMCFGSVGGRGERPVNMTRVDTVRIDRVYE